MKKALPFILLLLFSTVLSAQTNKPEFHQFDFWIGKWDVYKNGTDTLVGHSFIESILDSVAIRETYSVKKGTYKGTSLNKYNPQLGLWEQFWVDNGGLTLLLKGGFKDNKMVLEGETIISAVLSDKQIQQERITWSKNTDGTVRQVWEQRIAGQEKWKVVFDGVYRRVGKL